MHAPDAQVSELLVAWRLDIDSEPFAHQAALDRAAHRWQGSALNSGLG
jgi:hypothetical protein